MTYHIAVDIGASSGRLILADFKKNKWKLSELHRFKNDFHFSQGHDRWDVEELFRQIIVGLEKAKQRGIEKCTLGIDTWAVDYVLLKGGRALAQPIAYRDKRTEGAKEEVFVDTPAESIYKKTGIQFLNFNTLFQYVREDRELLKQAELSLLIPDYLAFRLTGKTVAEKTNASTTQLLNIHSGDYDQDLLELAGVRRRQLPELIDAGVFLGSLLDELQEDYHLPDVSVYAVASHDTASAVVGVPSLDKGFAFISSGTWSLIGAEVHEPIVTKDSYQANYTNEWGAYHTYRFLKNITGMWAVQEIARCLDYKYSYAKMAEEAASVKPFEQYVDLNDERFTNPENMILEIQSYCRENGEKIPETVGELTMCVYSNLALIYAEEWQRLESLTGKKYEVLHIVGGGSNVALLNQLTADAIGKPVLAGPSEATAVGNLLVQLIATGVFADLREARCFLREQTELTSYLPKSISHIPNLQK